jgi:hypothetical protein
MSPQLRADLARAYGAPELAHPDSHAAVAAPPAGYDPWWDAPIWGMPKIAPELGKGLATVYGMMRKGVLDGYVTQVGGQYVTTRRRLHRLLTGQAAG